MITKAKLINRLFTSIALAGIFSLTPVTLYAAIDSNVQNQQQQSLITIGVVGDSLSAGYGLKAGQGWVVQLEQRLNTLDTEFKIINTSVSGATTDAGLQMQAGLLQFKPDIVILELGANDGLQGKPLDLIYNNLAQLIEQAKSSEAEVLLLGVKLPPNLGKRYTEPFFEQYATLAEDFKIALVPFFLEGIAGNPLLMQADGLHQNQEAQIKILDNIWPALKNVIDNIERQKSSTAIAK